MPNVVAGTAGSHAPFGIPRRSHCRRLATAQRAETTPLPCRPNVPSRTHRRRVMDNELLGYGHRTAVPLVPLQFIFRKEPSAADGWLVDRAGRDRLSPARRPHAPVERELPRLLQTTMHRTVTHALS